MIATFTVPEHLPQPPFLLLPGNFFSLRSLHAFSTPRAPLPFHLRFDLKVALQLLPDFAPNDGVVDDLLPLPDLFTLDSK